QHATASYEAWMRNCTAVVSSDLRLKHQQMKESPFLFLRGSFYRWAQMWPSVCADLCDAPNVLAVGDLHVNSFGTWRDAEGRLCWGVDDFDDSYPLPFTNDLVRLATSVKLLTDSSDLNIRYREGCEAILEGYEQALKEGGCPFVLAEHYTELEQLGIEATKPPPGFWDKLLRDPVVNTHKLPPDARRALEKTLPPRTAYKIVRRKAGMGSLGQRRFVAIAIHEGGYIGREAKATVPSASVWKAGKLGHRERYYERAIASAVRSHDPYQRVIGDWLIRRLSPDSNPIEIADLPKKRDEHKLLHAMGKEVGNVHLGERRQRRRILQDVRRRPENWLRRAGKQMARIIEKEWKQYRKTR
ncbi:MAG TPA: DUF2252 family protein, partial [Candidatus Acidoferrum sp.]|nr:DUF2252 family protein [Candidatus Acidoferrum sp.]